MATIPASENIFPLVELAEGAAPATPPTGQVRLYVKSDGLLYWKDDAGTEYPAGAGSPAAGDIAFTPAGTIAATDVQAAIEEVAAEATGGSFDEDLLPWTIQLLPFLYKSTTGFALSGNDDAAVLGIVGQSSGTQNDEIAWDIVLAAGTWTFKLYHTQSTNRGIYTVSLAGASQGTIDGYNGSPTNNVTSSITGITVATSQKYEFKLKMATKNGSSSSYFGSFAMCQWHRTA